MKSRAQEVTKAVTAAASSIKGAITLAGLALIVGIVALIVAIVGK